MAHLPLDSPLPFRLYSSHFSNDGEEYAERIWTERERRWLQAFLQISPPKVAPELESKMSVRPPILGQERKARWYRASVTFTVKPSRPCDRLNPVALGAGAF